MKMSKSMKFRILEVGLWTSIAFLVLMFIVVACELIVTNEERLTGAMSSDGTYEAWIAVERRIGGDVRTVVFVRDYAEVLRFGSGAGTSVVTFNGLMREPALRISWQDERTLIVEYYPYIKSEDVRGAETAFKDVRVVMQKMPVTPTPR